jgi:hypothetical protein
LGLAAGQAITATDVCRGVTRLFAQAGLVVIPEVPLPNGRRADLLAVDAKGQVTIVEVKVSRADLHGDGKWPDYCDWCDRFYWALAAGLDPAILDTSAYRPEMAGLIIADRYGAAVVREAAVEPIAGARRKSEMLRLTRLAMRRLMVAADPDLAADWADG